MGLNRLNRKEGIELCTIMVEYLLGKGHAA